MKNLICIFSILIFAKFCFAGDPFAGFLPFAGNWMLKSCDDKTRNHLYLPTIFSISVAGTRKNDFNVYFLNYYEKKISLWFSSNPELQSKSFWKLVKSDSNDGVIQYSGTNDQKPFDLKFKIKDEKTLESTLSQDGYIQNCVYQPYKVPYK